VHWITVLKIFACTLGHRSVHACLTHLLLRAIDLQIDAVEKIYGKSLWTRTLEGTKDADTVLKVFRNISSLCDVFQVGFSHHGQRCLYIDCLAKIDTQLHTEVKVEEIFKVFPPKHE
jgi:aerobic-type carbon monoxide dehydrogenase small subunit (CoxS/CutS family)